MSRTALAAVIALVAVSVAGSHAQSTVVNLTGRWMLTDSPSPAVSPSVNPFGATLTISQSANAVTLADSTLSVTYQLDRIEHDLPKAARPSNTVSYFTNVATSGTGTYRASVSSAQVIVVRRDSVSLGDAAHQRTIGRVIRQGFTLAGDGSLVIDSLMITDPLGIEFFFNATAPLENPPANIRTVYRKAQ